MTAPTIQDVKKAQRKHRIVSIPLLQSKLKLSHEQARIFLRELRLEAEKRQKGAKSKR